MYSILVILIKLNKIRTTWYIYRYTVYLQTKPGKTLRRDKMDKKTELQQIDHTLDTQPYFRRWETKMKENPMSGYGKHK